MAEKNIAALVREDTKTIGVKFYKDSFGNASEFDPNDDSISSDLSPKTYTYVTHLPVKISDLVVVRAAGQIKVAVVYRVDDGVNIEPGSSQKYSWVIDKIDQEAYEAEMNRNEEIERTVADAYKMNIRKQFQSVVMANLDGAGQEKLKSLIYGEGVMPK